MSAKIVGDIDWTLRRGNVVMQTILVAVDVKVTQEVQLEVVTDVIGAGKLWVNARPTAGPIL